MKSISLNTIVFATLLTSTVLAADPSCDKSMSILNQVDLTAIKHCKTFQGTITIQNVGPVPGLRLEGIESITGDLILSGNPGLGSFSAPQLKTVQGAIKITNHTILSKADFPQLTEAASMTLSVLPALESIQFPSGLVKVGSMTIEDTRAPKVDGFKPESIGSFTLNNNNYMKSFDFSSVKQASEIMILGNNRALSFDAPNLETLKSATFINLAKLTLSALTTVRSDLSFHENELDSLKIDALQSIGGTFTIANNLKLAETSFSNLRLVSGALAIGNNTALKAIEGFPALAEIHGTCDLAGSFDAYSLPALQDVRGGMRIQTTSSKLACSDLERKLKGDGIVKGTAWSCSASMQEDQMVPTLGQNPLGGNTNNQKTNSPNKNPFDPISHGLSIRPLPIQLAVSVALGLVATLL
ncbi:hypothetical protein G6F46_008052 [Rhizopus delemar]|uniref:Receptor L-domain domain-containing protein n=3 Tax=Rhizopus TaxID=4842 RepID=I1CTV6_RHIO9|nr:hypothetical protein RO3G_16597 [Rhizopus delemar RA 99-880]KAG1455625.1 hypothetical protein G6F55_006968 [Rhizopus delemar]KAG1552128.1 hypothetical protein G6F51_001410 [Rhizopus arrhizus]KAG1499833.1 hypothetical protein G6F54_004134 [Rhizopus delemar]KAG1508941.1 hypothetical protein G6F53_007818 [Rhizopus delemar]|eukprot:EIE91886.1 hypothetical protein RO3G_16597 [Rhizopus delemar RA 99-880]